MTTATEGPSDDYRSIFSGLTSRAVAGIIGVAGILIFLALATHNSGDASFWNATSAATRNWLGILGANFSAFSLIVFGYAAWLIPLALILWAVRLWTGNWDRIVSVPLRLIPAGLLALIASAGFLSALPGRIIGTIGYGGWVGDFVIQPFARLFASIGSSAPFQIPGLLFGLLALVALAIACGTTWGEARLVWQKIIASYSDLFSRERRTAIAETTMSRTRDLTERLRGPLPEAINPPQLGGMMPLRANAEKPEAVAKAQPAPRASRKANKSAAPAPMSNPPSLSLDLLAKPQRAARQATPAELRGKSDELLKVLGDYGVKGEIVAARQGPVVTLHELEPAAGTKAARVVGLSDDIARSMSALSARVAPVRGRSVIGIEMPNVNRETVHLREVLDTLVTSQMPLPLALGKEIDGSVKFASLTKMPHLLVAGTTGAGKSVAINAMILSLLYRHSPDECRLIMVDPKMLELSVYDGIPHLLSPVVTDPKKAVMALKWVVREMENRYQKMAAMNVRGIDGYNQKMRDLLKAGEKVERETLTEFGETRMEKYDPETLPYIVVIVDEMADLMMVAGKEIEACIQRLAQMARASGIHLIMATQRPSVDVITGTIKANFPTRISFQVTSKIDSRTSLGEQGAEQLLGQGDMLYMAGGGRITRVHGPFVSDEEVQRVTDELRRFGAANDLVSFEEEAGNSSEIDEILGLGGGSDDDALYDEAVAIVARDRRATTSYIQRRLQIGYNRAARLIESMEEQGVISSANNAGKREVLIEER